MLKINLYKNKVAGSESYGKVYGRVETADMMTLEELAAHMADHSSPYTKGVIKGILTDMASCIKELMLQGQPVKLADLAIFKASVTSSPAVDAVSFDLGKHIKNVRLTAVATGIVTRKKLTEDALLQFTTLAQKVRTGEVQLSTGKSGNDDEPMVNP